MALWLKPEYLAVLLSYSTSRSKSLCSCVVAIEKGLFVAVFTTLRTHCAVCQKTTFEYYFACKMIVHFVMLPLLLSGQAQLSSGLLYHDIGQIVKCSLSSDLASWYVRCPSARMDSSPSVHQYVSQLTPAST